MSAKKPILCIDFDGVIHDYKKGWQNGEIYGRVTEGFWEWAMEASKLFSLVVYSSRSKTLEMRNDMEVWIGLKYLDWKASSDCLHYVQKSVDNIRTVSEFSMEYASEKPPAFLTIDDRALTFHGSWNDGHLDPERLRAFKPWNAK